MRKYGPICLKQWMPWQGDQLPELPELKDLNIAVLFNTVLLVGNRRGFAVVSCSSWSAMRATLLEGYALENAENVVDRRTIERLIEADAWLDMLPTVLLLRFRRPWWRINGGRLLESYVS